MATYRIATLCVIDAPSRRYELASPSKPATFTGELMDNDLELTIDDGDAVSILFNHQQAFELYKAIQHYLNRTGAALGENG